MAFGDALRPSDGATVVLNVDTSQTAKLERAEAEWRESVGTMSREALKLDLAQDRLKKSLAAYGAESAQAKRATIALKDAEEQAARSADKLTRETTQLNAAQDRQRRGMSSMTKGVIGLAGAYFGVHGLISGVRSAVSAYREQEVVAGQTRIGVESLGIAYDDHAAKIERVVRATSQLGFDDEALYQSFLKLVRGTKDVDVALERMALAAGVARGTFGDLESGTNIVVKAQLGMSGALRRAGLDVEKNATRTELLTFLTEQFGQSAVKAADDGAVAGERFAVEWENLKEILGSGVSPALADISTRIADYLGDAENQAEIQRKVNEAMETGEEVVRGIAGAFRIANRAISPFVRLVGGAEEAVKLLILAMAVGKVLSFARAIRLVGTNARFAAGGMAAMGAASAVGGRGGLGLALGLNPAGLIVAGGAAAIMAGLASGNKDAISQQEFEQLKQAARTGQLTFADVNAFPAFALNESQRRTLKGLIAQAGAAGIPDREGRGPRVGPRKPPPEDPPTGASGPTLEDLLLDVARPGNERADLLALRAYYARQIKVLEAKKNLTKAQKEALRALYGEIASVQSQIDALEEEQDRKEDEVRRKRQERERRREQRETAEEVRRARAAANRYGRQGMGRSTAEVQRELDKAQKAKQGEKDKALTEADVRRIQNEWITGLQGITNQFGSNITADGAQTATNTWRTTKLMEEQNTLLGYLARTANHPGATFARTELGLAYGGVGGV